MSLQVAVIGASGIVGEQVLEALSTAQAAGRLPTGDVRAFASRACRVEEVGFGERRIGVEQVQALLEERAVLAFLCTPPAVTARLAPSLSAAGALVVDVGGATELPWFLPGHVAPDIAEVAARGGVRTPSGPGWVLATVLAPLMEIGLTSVSGVLTLPGTVRGRAGMEELGAQVVASFNAREAPHRVFPEGLAFDVLPEDGPPDEWSDRERQAAAEVEALTGLSADQVAVSFCTGSVFAGIAGGLHLRGVEVEAVQEALQEAPGLKEASRPERLRPRALVERNRVGVYWGRVRADPSGDGVHVWVVGDNLSGAGGHLPVQAAEWMFQQGLFGREEA